MEDRIAAYHRQKVAQRERADELAIAASQVGQRPTARDPADIVAAQMEASAPDNATVAKAKKHASNGRLKEAESILIGQLQVATLTVHELDRLGKAWAHVVNCHIRAGGGAQSGRAKGCHVKC